MANSDWTQEERERAADDFSGELMRTGHGVVTVILACGDRVHLMDAELNLQCSLNRLQGKFAEAREMLRNIENRLYPEWPISQDIVAWLSRNK